MNFRQLKKWNPTIPLAKLKECAGAEREIQRPSPTQPAKLCDGIIMLGHDDNLYKSVNGKWQKIKDGKTPNEYYSQLYRVEKIIDEKPIEKAIATLSKELRKINVFIIYGKWKVCREDYRVCQEIELAKLAKREKKLFAARSTKYTKLPDLDVSEAFSYITIMENWLYLATHKVYRNKSTVFVKPGLLTLFPQVKDKDKWPQIDAAFLRHFSGYKRMRSGKIRIQLK